MNTPVVSIIMPTYNVEAFLDESIGSVLAQTFQDWELLVVDDGSTDNSNAVARRYAQSDPRIMVLEKPNGGLSDARNYGLQYAVGKYVHFFDSDDTIVPEFYETLVGAIGDDDFIICGYYRDYVTPGGNTSTRILKPVAMRPPLPSDMNHMTQFGRFFNYAWNKLFKAEFLVNNKLEYEKGLSIIEDKEFMSRVILRNPEFSFIDFAGYRYKIRQRETLGNNRYSPDLVPNLIRGIIIQGQVLSSFFPEEIPLKKIRGQFTMDDMKWACHCITTFSDMSRDEQIEDMSDIINHPTTQFFLKGYWPDGIENKIFVAFAKMRSPKLIHWLYSLKKKHS